MFISRALSRSWIKPTSLPSSIRTVRSVAVPSSSVVSEPRRSAMVPSSITVTSGAAMVIAHEAGKGRGLLAVEIALEAVPDGLVQQDAGPAGTQHHLGFAGGAPAANRD